MKPQHFLLFMALSAALLAGFLAAALLFLRG